MIKVTNLSEKELREIGLQTVHLVREVYRKRRGHVLLYGPPGLGKTTLSAIMRKQKRKYVVVQLLAIPEKYQHQGHMRQKIVFHRQFHHRFF